MKNIFLHDSDITYLNHGSFGACPKPVFEAYQNYQLMLERNPMDFITRKLENMMHETRTKLASFINTKPENLVFVTNATTAVNIIANSLELGEDDEVLCSTHEYGALDRMWRIISERKGFKCRYAKIKTPLNDAKTFVDDFMKRVTDKTKVVFLSQITSPTALVLPVKEICKQARERGIITIIDGAHVPGQIDLDIEDMNPDFYTGNCHKWLLSAKGAALLYVKPEFQEIVKPNIISWSDTIPGTGKTKFIAETEFNGTQDFASFLSVSDAVDFHNKYFTKENKAGLKELLNYAVDKFKEIFKTEAITENPDFLGYMYAHPLPKEIKGKELQTKLFKKYKIEIPVTKTKYSEYLRISVQLYNSKEDVDKLINAIKEIVGSL